MTRRNDLRPAGGGGGGGKYFAVRVVSCCAVSVGVFSNFPLNLQVSTPAFLLRGSASAPIIVSNITFFVPKNETDYTSFRDTTNTGDDDNDITLDFFVSGFPKCGTTTLLKTFEQHSETVVPPMEECSLDQVFQDDMAYKRLTEHLKDATNTTSLDIKRGIKCPFGLTTLMAIERLEEWFPNTKLIFGLRHPVYYFQSFYNYRVLMVHQDKLEGPIPSPESLIGSDDWIRVSTETARFEKVLEKLGKTEGSDELKTPFKVFLYTLEQMEDENEDRKGSLRATLGSFLELKKPIEPLPRANQNVFVGKEGFEETIDICDTEHDKLRNVLVENGKKTLQWILDEFLKSPDVIVANEGHFHEIVSQWGLDPCINGKGEVQAEK